MGLKIGDTASNFKLPGVDGASYSLDNFIDSKILVIIFSCNHCPYVVSYEARIIELQKKYKKDGVSFVLINPNDEKVYAEDSFNHMVARAKEKQYNFPYLRDTEQDTAKAYGAVKTPHVFMLDKERKLRYAGAIDDNWDDPQKVKNAYLMSALESLLEEKEPPVQETLPVGCTVKWAKK
ncbi:thioredoxin family protein [Elusimicrobiota bacterium]